MKNPTTDTLFDTNLRRVSGIYLIQHIASKKVYVGSSKDLGHRRSEHFTTLERGRHKNRHLQRAFTKHGRIEHREIRGGSRTRRTMGRIRAANPNTGQKYFVLLVDCGGDELVKERIREEHDNLTNSGYSRVIGIRDVRPQFAYGEIPRLEANLPKYIKTKLIPVTFILAIMEIEAWFLAEATHYQRIETSITVEAIKANLGFDPENDDMAQRLCPADDLNNCYAIGGKAYEKHAAKVTVDALDEEIMIRIRSVKYTEFRGEPQEWVLEGLTLAERNLIVGTNASGKTRTLNIIGALGRQLAGIDPPRLSGDYDVEFISDDKIIRYQLKYEEEQVLEEKFSIDGHTLLDRSSAGEGVILAEAIDGGKEIRFQTPTSEIAAVARRDTIQHKFLEPLYSWGSSLRHYYFRTPLGKDQLALFIEKGGAKSDSSDTNAVVALFKQAEKEFGERFRQALMQDLSELEYYVEEVGVRPPVSIRVSGLPGELVGLYVKEKDLPGITDQHSMSQGMFRVLSLLIQINYSQMTGKYNCILIDDIGEGLDFNRSCRLIDLLREKAKTSNIQLVLSTNDRFVMNRVPLEEWSVLQRRGNHVKVLNYNNSKSLFEEFKFTGLSNFSFLEMDFASGLPVEEAAAHE